MKETYQVCELCGYFGNLLDHEIQECLFVHTAELVAQKLETEEKTETRCEQPMRVFEITEKGITRIEYLPVGGNDEQLSRMLD